MKIIKIESSELKTKRFKLTLDDGSVYNFGLKGGSTYLDHHDKLKRENYRKRHFNNPLEEYPIKNFIPSAELFSYYLLWGDTTDLQRNITWLNKKMK